MSETSSSTNSEIITISLIEKSGLQPYINDVSEKYKLKTFNDQTDIPISPEQLPKRDLIINFNSNVKEQIEGMHAILEETDMGLEYPYCLLGRMEGQELTVDEMILLYSDFDMLTPTNVHFDPKLLSGALHKVRNDPQKNVFVLSHTHPDIPEQLRSTVLTTGFSQDDRNKYRIREVGLNLSMQDLYQLTSLREQVGSETEVFSSILMYNGDVVFVGVSKEGFTQTSKKIGVDV